MGRTAYLDRYQARLVFTVDVDLRAADEEEAWARAEDVVEIIAHRKIPQGTVYRPRGDGPSHVAGAPAVVKITAAITAVTHTEPEIRHAPTRP